MTDELLLIIAAVVAVLAWFEWAKFDKEQKREKIAFLALLFIDAVFTAWLIFFPETPGPNEWIDMLFKPLEQWLAD